MDDKEPRYSRGVRVERRSAGVEAWLLGVALVFVLVAIGVSIYVMTAPVDVPELDEVASDGRDVGAPYSIPSAVTARERAPVPAGGFDGDAGEDSGASGDVPSGIALFPPPGTDPPKIGILVPEGFELPPGYVRHYQSTDDGEPLAAILMFHPDYVLRDANGQPLPLPEDRVVPPELAPPGMPIRILELPEPALEAP